MTDYLTDLDGPGYQRLEDASGEETREMNSSDAIKGLI